MITREQLDRLLQFRNGEYLITSCYLNLDRSKMPPHMLKIRIKDLVQSAQQELSGKAGTHAQRESLRRDFKLIEDHVLGEMMTNSARGLAIFSCSGEKFWQSYRLPRMGRNILIADRDPYIRPLTAILAEYHRYGTVLVDRSHGRIFEVYMGEILERSDIVERIHRLGRAATHGDRGNERRIQGHEDSHVHQHLQRVADATFELFKRDNFDWLILGGHHDVLPEFKKHLHPYLRERWVADFHAEPHRTTVAEVLERTLEIEERVEREHERRLATELVQKAEAKRLAVAGLTPTLEALRRGEAALLLVEDGFEMPGYVCYGCHYVSLEPQPCPNCGGQTEPCPDLVDEAIELAMQKNCQIEHVHGPTVLRDAGRIGALLRYHARAEIG